VRKITAFYFRTPEPLYESELN